MKEEYLHFLWKYKRFTSSKFTTTENFEIEVVNFGFHNLHSGPDFLNGQVRFNEVLLVGSIEFHLKSSDWYAHNHQNDEAYNNVILHVVLEHNREVLINGEKIPTIELKSLIDEEHLRKFESHLLNPDISCSKRLGELSEMDWVNHLDALSISRLERKLEENKRLLTQLDHDFHKLFMVLIARTLGGKVNSESFELLCNRIDTSDFSKFCVCLFNSYKYPVL